MKLDKNIFPPTPDFIKETVEETVRENLNTVVSNKKRKFPKYIAAGIITILCLGTTVYAATKLFDLSTEKKGNYGMETKISSPEDDVTENNATEYGTTENETIMDTTTEAEGTMTDKNVISSYTDSDGGIYLFYYVALDFSYMPEDMSLVPDPYGNPKRWLESSRDKNSRSVTLYMDKIPAGSELTYLDTDIVSSKDFSTDKGSGIAMEMFDGKKKLYFLYNDTGYQLTMRANSGMTIEELIDIASGITPTVISKADVDSGNIDYNHVIEANAYFPPSTETQTSEAVVMEPITEEYPSTITKDQLSGIYQIGNGVKLSDRYVSQRHTSTITDVQICDDLSPIPTEHIEYLFGSSPDFLDENGKLKDQVITYYKEGDGINTLDEAVKTVTMPVKLVYITMECTYESEGDVLFYLSPLFMTEDSASYSIYDSINTLADNTDYDYADVSHYRYPHIYTYNGNDILEKNHFTHMVSGGTGTAYYAFIVREDELPYMYLDLKGNNNCYFMPDTLNTGLVDIRQNID